MLDLARARVPHGAGCLAVRAILDAVIEGDSAVMSITAAVVGRAVEKEIVETQFSLEELEDLAPVAIVESEAVDVDRLERGLVLREETDDLVDGSADRADLKASQLCSGFAQTSHHLGLCSGPVHLSQGSELRIIFELDHRQIGQMGEELRETSVEPRRIMLLGVDQPGGDGPRNERKRS